MVVYTIWLKRRTPQNIVIGGAAGAVPPLVGWAAVTGEVGLPAVFMFAIIFYWTPPHFWALAILAKDEYAKAGVPMLPVVRGERETARQILLYTVLLVGVTVLPFLAGSFGAIYLTAPLVLGAAFLVSGRAAGARASRPAARDCSSTRSPTWPCCSPRSGSTGSTSSEEDAMLDQADGSRQHRPRPHPGTSWRCCLRRGDLIGEIVVNSCRLRDQRP